MSRGNTGFRCYLLPGPALVSLSVGVNYIAKSMKSEFKTGRCRFVSPGSRLFLLLKQLTRHFTYLILPVVSNSSEALA